MIAKLFAGLVLSLGLFFVATGFAEQKSAPDCCTDNLACCVKGEACCLDCCAQGMKCCDQNAPCCAAIQNCCKAGAACCDEAQACCGPTVQMAATDCCSAAK